MDFNETTLGQCNTSIQLCAHHHSKNSNTVSSPQLEQRLQNFCNGTAAQCSCNQMVNNATERNQSGFVLSDPSGYLRQHGTNSDSFKLPDHSSETDHSVIIETSLNLHDSKFVSHDKQPEAASRYGLTHAGLSDTLVDCDVKSNSQMADPATDDLIDSNFDNHSQATIDELIESSRHDSHPAPIIKVTDFDLETESDPIIDRLIASVAARASPTDLLTPPHDRSLDSESDAEDRKLLRGFSPSPDRLSPLSGAESPSSFYNVTNSSKDNNIGTMETNKSQNAVGLADRDPVISSLSNIIKRALSDKRHAHRPRSPWGEVDEVDSSSRLYQSDSYLPALRLQLDTQSPPVSPFSPFSPADQTRFTLPLSAGRNGVNFPNPPQTLVREESQCDDSANSSISFIAGSSAQQSTEFQESTEQKSSPPISPLTRGLHCSSLSLYLPPPSIRSLNKMWHRCYSGESLSGDEQRSEPGKLAVDHPAHYDLAAKVILLGDYSVGKTSFLSTLAKAKDENGSGFCREYRAGELAEVVFKRQQKRAMIRVMDTGGQERYRSMTSSYYRGVHGCLLVFDVTREDTFNNIMIWHSDLQKYSTDQYVAAILVGTTSHPGERVISPERGLKLAESLGIPYMECSPDDASMTLGIVQRLTEKVIKFALRRSSFAIDIKPKSIVLLEENKKKKFVCLC